MNLLKITLFLAITSTALTSVQVTRSLKDLYVEGLDGSSDIEAAKKYFMGYEQTFGKDICPDSLFLKIIQEMPNDYPFESHHVTTEDNYILRLFRI